LLATIPSGNAEQVAALLQEGADPNAQGQISSAESKAPSATPLIAASAFGHEAIVQKLIASGANVDMPDGSKFRWNALMVASFRGHEDVVRTLLDHGAQLNAADALGTTALSYAGFGKQPKIEKLLGGKGGKRSPKMDFNAALNAVLNINSLTPCSKELEKYTYVCFPHSESNKGGAVDPSK